MHELKRAGYVPQDMVGCGWIFLGFNGGFFVDADSMLHANCSFDPLMTTACWHIQHRARDGISGRRLPVFHSACFDFLVLRYMHHILTGPLIPQTPLIKQQAQAESRIRTESCRVGTC